MILKNKLYIRKEPTRDARLIIIYCEGKKRESQYFKYFSGISPQIRLEIESPEHEDNNSPTGLYQRAKKHLCNKHEDPKYELLHDDQVWFVIDTDTWGDQISALRSNCEEKHNWFVAQNTALRSGCVTTFISFRTFKAYQFQQIGKVI